MRVIWGVLILALIAGAGGVRDSSAQESGLPRFERTGCLPGMDAETECGFLVVPEDRSDPQRPAIRLAVVILKSRSETPAPDPVIYLAGGPGGSGTEAFDTWADSALRDARDVILLDQRGTGLSKPSLNCPELEEAQTETLGNDPRLPDYSMRIFEAFINCHKRLLWEGINLSAYTTAANAADVADLRVALGYPAVNLLGVSYGTRLALTVMRDYPDGVRSVIIDSVYPPNVNLTTQTIPNALNAFEQVFAACDADPACHARYPDLEMKFVNVIAQLNTAPQRVALGSLGDVVLTGDRVFETLFLALYNVDFIPYMPALIDQLNQGEYLGTAYLFRETTLSLQPISEGVNYSVQCYEQDPFVDKTDLDAVAAAYPDFADLILKQSSHAGCVLWDVGAAGETETQPVTSDIPTLILSGEFDPVTPPAWGQLAAETLSHSYVYEFPGLSHAVMPSECPLQVVLAFLDNPATAPDAGCRATMLPPTFFTTN